jgi:undecaprenyl-diphosphatase
MNWEGLTGVENKFLYFLNGQHHPVFDAVSVFVASSSDVVIFSLALILLLLPRRTDKVAGLLLLTALEVSYQVSHGLKVLIARPRPSLTLDGVVTLFKAGDFSMPSGHAVMAFAAAFILSRSYGKGPLFYLLATVIAFSRIYAGVHYVSDILVGAVIGLLIGYVLTAIADSIFPINNNLYHSGNGRSRGRFPVK